MLLSRITEAKLAVDDDFKQAKDCKSESKNEEASPAEAKAESKGASGRHEILGRVCDYYYEDELLEQSLQSFCQIHCEKFDEDLESTGEFDLE
jgi:hypothetical protein